jgi:hypothetical protein
MSLDGKKLQWQENVGRPDWMGVAVKGITRPAAWPGFKTTEEGRAEIL